MAKIQEGQKMKCKRCKKETKVETDKGWWNYGLCLDCTNEVGDTLSKKENKDNE